MRAKARSIGLSALNAEKAARASQPKPVPIHETLLSREQVLGSLYELLARAEAASPLQVAGAPLALTTFNNGLGAGLGTTTAAAPPPGASASVGLVPVPPRAERPASARPPSARPTTPRGGSFSSRDGATPGRTTRQSSASSGLGHAVRRPVSASPTSEVLQPTPTPTPDADPGPDPDPTLGEREPGEQVPAHDPLQPRCGL